MLALESVVRVGNHLSFRVGMLKSYNIDCRCSARRKSRWPDVTRPPNQGEIEEVLRSSCGWCGSAGITPR